WAKRRQSPNPAITSVFDYFVGSDSVLGSTVTWITKRLILSALGCRARTVGMAGSGSTVERCMPNGRHAIDQPDEGNHDAGGHGRKTQSTIRPPESTHGPHTQEH